jgi:hypothetical protein
MNLTGGFCTVVKPDPIFLFTVRDPPENDSDFFVNQAKALGVTRGVPHI